MLHSARISTDRVITFGFIILGVWAFLALVAIIIMAKTIDSLRNDQQIVVTPMAYNAPFAISMNTASPELKLMWAMTFAGLRLNVSPGNVDAQHEFLLRYIKPGSQPELSVTLAEEARRIKQSGVTSVFHQTGYFIYPNNPRIEVTGILYTWIGNSKPEKETKRYILELEYANGVTYLTRFVEPENEKQ
ncbi:type IV conjugative transfer system protein TraE [Budviciaceae bacterium BWR-B9]|uniref:Type IV conjugative transfer system protein TraE n=1 Tax=Limnobaculum allomyrinae TaxID=2791986 RepID=A0ABS1IUX0_9GAMM|nr:MULTISPECIES: type IV conjugative transfer system protein TraE [Limnobaculum]MBK5145551.1 type IV conjugative transfer system protein TraE [Limnobaculum allomyrinae]MBV7693669.1 type IV conjugative transfer system protein TraE [Limnobaculum sp. M2-1]